MNGISILFSRLFYLFLSVLTILFVLYALSVNAVLALFLYWLVTLLVCKDYLTISRIITKEYHL